MQVILALHGSMGRLTMSKWLLKTGVPTLEALEWNELTQILHELFHARTLDSGFDTHHSLAEPLRSKVQSLQDMKNPVFIIVVDLGLLNWSTNIWKEQLNFLDKFSSLVKFAWMLNHDTSNAIKMELRRKGHILMVNKPLYKAKMLHILEAVIKESYAEPENRNPNGTKGTSNEGDSHECLEIDSTQFETCSSDDSDETAGASSVSSVPIREQSRDGTILKSSPSTLRNCLVEFTRLGLDQCNARPKLHNAEDIKPEKPDSPEQPSIRSNAKDRVTNEPKSLQGLRILLAEDTPVLQRVATIMLEKMGAVVVAVGDGVQAVEALNSVLNNDNERRNDRVETEICDSPPYDLILMDCQVRKKNKMLHFSNQTP